MEALKELERLELALFEERRKTAELSEARKSDQESHARDVAMLEAMLQKVLQENERLQRQLASWEEHKLGTSGGGCDEGVVPKDDAQRLASDAEANHPPEAAKEPSPSEPEGEPCHRTSGTLGLISKQPV